MPAPSLLCTTELEAVNVCLATVGQAPVSTLEVAGIRDVSIARQRVHEASRALQARGWSFNTEYEVEYAIDVNGKTTVGTTVLAIDPSDRTLRVAQRLDGSTMRLYDLENHTFVFTQPVKCDVVTFLAFENLPQPARDYIAIIAARKFQKNNVGSIELDAYTEEDERRLRAEFLRDERRRADTNIFRGRASTNRIVHRRW